jgi:uncharacterized delta-60 repeat protein
MREGKLRGTIALAAAALVLAGAATAFGAFGTGGKVVVDVGGVNSAKSVAIGKDGTIVGAGSAIPDAGFDFAAVRLDSAGVPDPLFSGDGEQTTDLGDFDVASAVVIQKDGAIVLGGSSNADDDEQRASMVRYEPDGDLDPSFSDDGIQIFPFGNVTSDIDDMALQKDGKVVIAGSVAPGKMLVARVKPSGKPDKGFGKKGAVKIGIEKFTSAGAVAIQDNGRIVVAGDTSGGDMDDPSSQVYARLKENGKLDKSFSKDGVFTKKVNGASSRPEDITLDEENRILAAIGVFAGGESMYGVAAVNPNGKLDKKFGQKGMVFKDFGEDTSLVSIAVQKAGGIVVGGGVRSLSGDLEFLLSRFTKKGKLDESFGFKGATVTDFAGNHDLIQGLAIAKQDAIVAAGIGDGDFGFARYLPNGTIDD